MTAVLPGRRPVSASPLADRPPSGARPGIAPPELGGKPWWKPDAVALLSFWAGLLFLIPSRMVFGPAGAVGHPSTLFGLALAGWWAVGHAVPYLVRRGHNPMRRVLLVFGMMFGFLYAMGYARGLPPVEATAADRRLLMTASVIGVAMVALDGIRDRARLDRLLKRLTVFAAVNALVGMIQFTTDFDPAAAIGIPGLQANSAFTDFKERGASEFTRVTGTSTHPIEFGVMMSMVLPVALHYALHAAEEERKRRWLIAGILAVAVPMSVSRSGTLALFAVMLVLGHAWAPIVKVRALGVTVAGMVALSAVVPGLLGTIRSSFMNLGNDPSIEGRTEDYDNVFAHIADRPWFGRGPGTFLPNQYIILDNEALYTLVTTGYLGFLALLLLLGTAIVVARRLVRSGGDDTTRHLSQAFLAAVLAGIVTSFTFDSLSFPIFSGLLFFLFGVIGALWRLDRAGDRGDNPRRRSPLLKGWRSTEFPEPHPLRRMFPDAFDERRWKRSTS